MSGLPRGVRKVKLRHYLPRRQFLKHSVAVLGAGGLAAASTRGAGAFEPPETPPWMKVPGAGMSEYGQDRKSTRLNSSHSQISYAVFCLKKKKNEDGNNPNIDPRLKNEIRIRQFKNIRRLRQPQNG